MQAKLAVSVPGDALESEADAVAARVVLGATPAPSSARTGASGASSARPQLAATGFGTSVATALASGGGDQLHPALRARIEPHVGIDLGAVRVRREPVATAAARDLGARAFTSGTTIFLAAGSSPTDVGLMAHEAAHVAQQRGGGAARATLQRLPEPGGVLDWLLDSAGSTIRAIPGYALASTIAGQDLLTGRRAQTSRAELVETLLTGGPFAAGVGPALAAIGVLDRVFDVVGEELHASGLTRERIVQDIEAARAQLSAANGIAGNVAIVEGLVDDMLADVASFANVIADRVVALVRAAVADAAERLLQAPAMKPLWDLTRKVMGRDPLRGQPVVEPTVEILADLLRVAGEEQRLEQLRETGALQRTADWLDAQLATFAELADELGALLDAARDAVQPQNLTQLPAAVAALAQQASVLIERVRDFATGVLVTILTHVKDALLVPLAEQARDVPGYRLLTVVLGRDPITGEKVPFTPAALIGGFIALLPGGAAAFEELAKSGVIDEAGAQVQAALSKLGISSAFVAELFNGIWDSLSLDDLLDPIAAFGRIIARFGEPLGRLLEFVSVVVDIVVTLVLRQLNFPSALLASVIANASQAADDIAKNPVDFLLNMLRAVKLGFSRFLAGIGGHLAKGLAGWLFRGLGKLGIQRPPDLSPGSILTLAVEVLGLSAQMLWEKLGKQIGPERLALVRGGVDKLTGAWAFVADVAREGLPAIWRHVGDRLAGLWDTLRTMATEWIMSTIVGRVATKLLALLDPTGISAVITGFVAFFEAIRSAIEYARELLEIVAGYVQTLAAVAAGNVAPGAKMLEQGLVAAIPVAIGFLAAQVGLDDVPAKIVALVKRLRKLVDEALEWLIAQALRLGGAALRALGLGGPDPGGKPDDAPEPEPPAGPITFDIDFTSAGFKHELRTDPTGELVVASLIPTPLSKLRDKSDTITRYVKRYEALRAKCEKAMAQRRAKPRSRSGWKTLRKRLDALIERIVKYLAKQGMSDSPGASAPGLGDQQRHGDKGKSLRGPMKIWWLESEHMIPFTVGARLWDVIGRAWPERGKRIDKSQTTIMIYERAARAKTVDHDKPKWDAFDSKWDSGYGDALRLNYRDAKKAKLLKGPSAERVLLDTLLAPMLEDIRRIQLSSVRATVKAVAKEHGSKEGGTGPTNGRRRGEKDPVPARGALAAAAAQQYKDLEALVVTDALR